MLLTSEPWLGEELAHSEVWADIRICLVATIAQGPPPATASRYVTIWAAPTAPRDATSTRPSRTPNSSARRRGVMSQTQLCDDDKRRPGPVAYCCPRHSPPKL